MKKASAYCKGAVHEQSNYGNDIEQFGQLLATLLGNCHDSSDYDQVNKCHSLLFKKGDALLYMSLVVRLPRYKGASLLAPLPSVGCGPRISFNI